ncbi:orotidine-5'-phosphate decarboxylase [Bhargavaea ginsengi]|uniref:orotidine-5'-phosphate decarboxylase n=1 Tax=Bhargavaea ginsengi TaxID=426757 RepID=UPI00203C693F|nr:orotidine-5'-phosphate decarboxylase [Bhargavaea ginsengi]MCM3087364.1 orotidine-5'-phosphate decarboxylase [Bhargavaea ginsengi]
MNRSPIIALDFPAPDDAYAFLSNMPSGLWVKVGMELYLQNGPDVVGRLKDMGHEVFLDLKLHDIPNTVGRAMEGLARVGADMVNVHAAGGTDMMKRALDGLEAGTPAGKKRPALIAVTQLTSTGEGQMNSEQGIPGTLLDSVVRYARLANDSGLDGVVCSVLEAAAIRDACGENFLKVTPGIRMADGDLHDQKRVATPADAARAGSTHIVVGRAITQAADPAAAYETVKRLWEER